MKKTIILICMVLLAPAVSARADVVHADDVIITGSECVGYDCATDNSENFGFDTIKLKENNLRILFDDTSSTAGFPANDWRLIANDSTDGGANYFAIEDATAPRVPFKIMAGAPGNALFVGDTGRIGLGTSDPFVKLHLVLGDTPVVRLGQDTSSGWTEQVWDVAGNESNFFVRDVTGGSKLPFRIQPGTPTNALTLRADGKIGLGTWSPTATLHLERYDGTALIRVYEGSTEVLPRDLLSLENRGRPGIVLTDISTGDTWRIQLAQTKTGSGHLAINRQDGDGPEVVFMKNGTVKMGTGRRNNLTLSATGNLAIRGALTQGSDVNLKENISPVDGSAVLERIAALDVATWSYRDDGPAVRHMGPTAQDFRAAFGLGEEETSIAAIDADGVALAGIQELNRRLREKDAVIAALEERQRALEAQVKALAARLGAEAAPAEAH